jgi:hypothetical protein
MSARVISLNQDLKKLRDEGYELEIKEGHAIIHNVPYLNVDQTIQRGIFISPLRMNGDLVKYDGNHVIFFQGTHPYRADGQPMSGIDHCAYSGRVVAGNRVNFSFSNKPQGGYRDYYEKFTRYIEILQVEAQAIDPTVTAKTFKRIAEDENSIFVYADTNASRATITDITDKLRCQKIGIVGLGGTGSYVLDQVAKTPVSEIHLYDGDIFCQHNAFRAPGAPCKELLEESRRKTDYFAEVYGHMHKGIVSHPVFVTEANTHELTALDFVFLCMDTGEHKRVIINTLMEYNIAFIDTGIDISEHNRELLGTARTTSACFGDTVSDMDVQVVEENISFEPVTDADLYRSNIQTAELNAFCALMAVIKWKKHCGFYQDLCPYQNRVYNTNDGEFK